MSQQAIGFGQRVLNGDDDRHSENADQRPGDTPQEGGAPKKISAAGGGGDDLEAKDVSEGLGPVTGRLSSEEPVGEELKEPTAPAGEASDEAEGDLDLVDALMKRLDAYAV